MTLHEKIHTLYLLDKQLRGLQQRLDSAKLRQGAQQKKFDRLNQQREEIAAQVKQAKVTCSTLEHQAAEMDQRIDKHRSEMNQVRNNKEYQALLLEVNTLKVDKEKVEEETLGHMSRVEELEQQHKAVESTVAEQLKLVNAAESEVKTGTSEIGEQLDKLIQQRETAAQDLPTDVRETFDHLSEIHEGDAMAPVQEENRRHMEYTCGGCLLNIPIERVNEIMSSQEKLVCCPNCERILYMADELKEALGSS